MMTNSAARYSIATNNNATARKTTAPLIVTFVKTASQPLLFFFPKSCSAPPPMEPDKPALFPCCRSTNAISTTLAANSNIFNAMSKMKTLRF
jgi:hypothetical protein